MTLAVIAYAGRGVARPRYHSNDTSGDLLPIQPVEMDIRDARGLEMTLDGAGFTLCAHRSAVTDFTDRSAVDATYRPEIVALVGALSGADLVVVNNPGVLRFSERSAKSGTMDNSRPARFAHVDVSDATAAAFAQRASPEGRRVSRFAHYNIWRVISDPPQDVPLAVCDARSVAPRDLVPSELLYRDRRGETYNVTYSAGHRWFYAPQMRSDEALLIKCFDSRDDGRTARFAPHTAFEDPTTPANAPPRESLELRTYLFFGSGPQQRH